MSELTKLLEHCLKCSCCQSACPVVTHNADYPGPKILGPDLARIKYAGDEEGVTPNMELLKFLDMCSGCQCCEVACPFGVPVAQLIRQNRGLSRGKHSLRDIILAYPHQLGRVGTALAPLVNTALKNTVLQKTMSGMLGLDMEQPLSFAPKRDLLQPTLGQPAKRQGQTELSVPSKSGKPLDLAEQSEPSELVQRQEPAEMAGQQVQTLECTQPSVPRTRSEPAEKKVIYFTGCHVNYHEPEVGRAFLQILELLGVKALVSQDICCGMPILAAGNREKACSNFQHNLQYFKGYVEQGYEIVTTCPSCGIALKKIYVEELGLEDAQQVASATYDFAEYLEQYSSCLAALVHPVKEHVAYHLPCHTEAQGIGVLGINLMRLIPGLELEIVDGCCGQSGTYGFKVENRGVSMAISKALAQQITAVSPTMILTPCGSCKGRISYVTGMRTLHPVQILKAAVDTAGEVS